MLKKSKKNWVLLTVLGILFAVILLFIVVIQPIFHFGFSETQLTDNQQCVRHQDPELGYSFLTPLNWKFNNTTAKDYNDYMREYKSDYVVNAYYGDSHSVGIYFIKFNNPSTYDVNQSKDAKNGNWIKDTNPYVVNNIKFNRYLNTSDKQGWGATFKREMIFISDDKKLIIDADINYYEEDHLDQKTIKAYDDLILKVVNSLEKI